MKPKFRAWEGGTASRMYPTEEVMLFNGSIWIPDEGSDTNEWVENNDLELMQSTGFFDKNGKEIFEGDIVKRYPSPYLKTNWDCIVETVISRDASLLLGRKIGNDFATMPFGTPFSKSVFLEVVGNIYENKDISEVKE